MYNENWNDFLKQAIKMGKVKDVEEAWKDNPVEKEAHKGQISYFI